jgi:hypothetical protein
MNPSKTDSSGKKKNTGDVTIIVERIQMWKISNTLFANIIG